MTDLKKIEPSLAQALGSMRSAVKQGAIPPEHFQTLTRKLFQDPMIPAMGNRLAYSDFLDRPRTGVHIRIDGNDFGGINKLHGFETGNAAITQMGSAIHTALEETVGRRKAKSFRIGGDEFHIHVPDATSAHLFARRVRSKLEAIPSVGGTHNLSISIGFGHSPDHAEMALIHAKQAKKAMGYRPGQAQTHAHSLLPGLEGAVPVHGNEIPFMAPAQGAPGAPAMAAQPPPVLSSPAK